MTHLRPVRHRLVGAPSEVLAALDNAARRGSLVQVSSPRLLPGHRVAVDLVLMEPGPADPHMADLADPRMVGPRTPAVTGSRSWYRQVGGWLRVTAAVLALGALAGLAYLVYLAVAWVVANFFVIVGVLLVVAVAIGLISSSGGGGGGHHCPGCKG